MFTLFPQLEERFDFVMSGSKLDSYNKRQRDAFFLNFVLVKNSTCFGQIFLSIIWSLNTVFTAIDICHIEILKMVNLLQYIHVECR